MTQKGRIVVVNIFIYLIFIAGISFLYSSALYSNLVAIGLLVFNFYYFHDRKDILYFLVGLCLTTSTEIAAVHFGIWQYAYPHIFGIPVWLSLGWAYSFVFLREFEVGFYNPRSLNTHYTKYFKDAKRILITDVFVFLIALSSILLLWENNIQLTLFLGLLLLLYVFVHHDKDVVLLIVTAVLSYSVIDLGMTHIGLWTYTNTNFSSITTWLPVGYGLIAVIVSRISESLAVMMRVARQR